jgi:hypothetical protein
MKTAILALALSLAMSASAHAQDVTSVDDGWGLPAKQQDVAPPSSEKLKVSQLPLVEGVYKKCLEKHTTDNDIEFKKCARERAAAVKEDGEDEIQYFDIHFADSWGQGQAARENSPKLYAYRDCLIKYSGVADKCARKRAYAVQDAGEETVRQSDAELAK